MRPRAWPILPFSILLILFRGEIGYTLTPKRLSGKPCSHCSHLRSNLESSMDRPYVFGVCEDYTERGHARTSKFHIEKPELRYKLRTFLLWVLKDPSSHILLRSKVADKLTFLKQSTPVPFFVLYLKVHANCVMIQSICCMFFKGHVCQFFCGGHQPPTPPHTCPLPNPLHHPLGPAIHKHAFIAGMGKARTTFPIWSTLNLNVTHGALTFKCPVTFLCCQAI